jgi:hypothetical protein
MALVSPQLALPTGAETAAFRAVETVLKSDITLGRVVKAWRTWTGDINDILAPTFATCPYIQLSPAPAAGRWETEQQTRSPMVINITVATAGSDANQILNFWGAIRSALYPSDMTRNGKVLSIVQTAKITKSTLTLAAYGFKVTNDGLRMMVAKGALQLLLLVPTP